MRMIRQHGFTLIELVVAISISAIVVGFMVMFLVTPAEAYLAQARRAELVAEANMVANNMGSDLRTAVFGQVQYANNGAEVLVITPAAPNGPITYLCNSAAGTMTRTQLVGGNAQIGLLAHDVSFCQITYNAALPLRAKLVGLQMRLTRNGETMMVFRQMPLRN
jgi:MSHA biogenesis protein MshO